MPKTAKPVQSNRASTANTLHVLRDDARFHGQVAGIRRAAHVALASQRLRGVSLSILLADDTTLQSLSHDFRGKNKPTNVLSFPSGEAIMRGAYLGDIALSFDTITHEADAQHKPLHHHLAHLVIHGVLHLLGYDHETRRDANVMETLEIQLLAKLGIANPYIAR